MDAIEAIAHVLAAEKDPAVKDLPAYADAEAMVLANSRLAAWLERERAFFKEQDNVLSGVILSEEARARILRQLEQEQVTPAVQKNKMITLPRRVVWAWAAALAVLLLGVTYLAGLRMGEQRKYAAAQEETSLEAFRQFSVDQVKRGFRLDYRNASSQQVVNWLANEQGAIPQLSKELSRLPTMGCKVLGWNQHKVSLICFEQARGETVHLFVVDRNAHGPLPPGFPTAVAEVDGRATCCWQDADNTYIMVAHDEEQPLRPNSI